jgi:catechol 2,3-dioxygenase-like lactoylglutathione lyase family enzyme
MDQRISLITLGVTDMDRVAAFYEALGWARVETQDGVVAFDLIGQTLGLYPRAALASELGLPEDSLGNSAIVLSHNGADKADVAILLARAEAAGGSILNQAKDVFWGGHHGHFRDPEGTIWEVAHNPFSALGPKGEFQWNGVDAPS